jgi:hypothetical protein
MILIARFPLLFVRETVFLTGRMSEPQLVLEFFVEMEARLSIDVAIGHHGFGIINRKFQELPRPVSSGLNLKAERALMVPSNSYIQGNSRY